MMTTIPKFLKEKLSKGALYELYDFIIPRRYKLVDWVEENIDKINLANLCQDPKLLNIAEKYCDLLDINCWYKICSQQSEESIAMIHRNFDKFVARSDMSCFYKICSTPHLLALHIVHANIDILDKKCWKELSRNKNPNVLHTLYNNPFKADYFDWVCICQNHSQVPELLITLLEKFTDRITKECWRLLSNYEFAIPFLEKNQNKSVWFDWRALSANGGAINLLKNNIDKVIIIKLALNPNPEVIGIIQHILDTEPDELNDTWFWSKLCRYAQNTETFEFLDRNIYRLDNGCWYFLSKNAKALSFIQKYPEKIQWDALCENSAIYTIDHQSINQEIDFWISQK